MEEYIKHSDLNAGGNNYTRTLQIPKIYDRKTIDHFSEIVTTTYGIFEKVIQEYMVNPDYRKLFPFSKELEALILLPSGYAEAVPVCRIVSSIMKKMVILNSVSLIPMGPAQ